MTDLPETGIARLLADLDDESASTSLRADRVRTDLFRRIRLSTAQHGLPPVDAVPAAAAPYAEQVRLLADLLAGASEDQRRVPVVHGWVAWQVLGHLLAVDGLAAQALGLVSLPETGADENAERVLAAEPVTPDEVVTARTRVLHERYAERSLEELISVWQAQAAALLRQAAAHGDRGSARPVTYLGLQLTGGDVLLDRAFETWIHAEDLRAATGQASQAPPPAHVHLMSDLGARMIGPALQGLAGSGLAVPAGQVRIALSGAGGGTWDVTVPVARGPQPPVRAMVMMTAIDFCYLAGGHIGVDQVRHEAQGNAGLVRATLLAAAALSRV